MRDKFDYYPEAYAWLFISIAIYLLRGPIAWIYIGCLPGIALMMSFYIRLIREHMKPFAK